MFGDDGDSARFTFVEFDTCVRGLVAFMRQFGVAAGLRALDYWSADGTGDVDRLIGQISSFTAT